MLKILCLVDKKDSALDRLAKGVAKYHDNIDYIVADFHPKRPDINQIENVRQHLLDTDIIDAQYFRTIEKVRELFPEAKNIKTILSMNNPYSIEDSDWNTYDYLVGNNDYITERLGKITEKPVMQIPLTVDTDFWTFNPEWKPNNNVIMVANRIESKKGILPVAIACAELNLHFILVGAISDMNYFQSIMATTGNVEFHEQISDEELLGLYHKSTIHVCNSVDNFESGTLPILEAMLTGVPVLTRQVGHIPELYNGENMVLLEGQPEDTQGIQDKLFQMMSDKKALESLRDRAWQTAKSRSFERRAYIYQKLYREVLYPDQKSVSVVVPIYDKPEIIRKCLNAIAEQTYKNIELIICDDMPPAIMPGGDIFIDKTNRPMVKDFTQYISFPVKYINTSQMPAKSYSDGVEYNEDYGLARARNSGTIEATGEVIVYCDQRMIMEPNCIEEFVKHVQPKVWLYGNKGGKKDFVENLSCIRRQDVIDFGLFSERMDRYGGLSQETRVRFKHQGNRTEYVESARAIPTGKSSNRNQKRQDIIKSKNRLWKMGLEE